MAGHYYGGKHWIGVKEQSVAGTAETTVTNFFASEDFVMDPNLQFIPRVAQLATGVQQPNKPGAKLPNGSALTEVHASMPHPWYYVLGTDNVTTPSSGVKLHSITDGGEPRRLTIEGFKAFQHDKQADAYLNKLTLNFLFGEKATLALEWMSLGHLNDTSVTSTPAFTTDLLYCNLVTTTIATAVDATVKGGSLVIDNQLEQVGALVSANGFQPATIRRKEAAPKITGKLDFYDFPKAYLATFIAATPFAIVIELGGDNIAYTYNKLLRATLPACQWTDSLGNQQIAQQVISGSAGFQAFYDTSTSKQVLIESQNTISALTA